MLFVMTDEGGKLLAKSFGTAAGLFKAMKPDGDLDDAGQGPSDGDGDEHPHVVGSGDFDGAAPGAASAMKFAGRDYAHTGREGQSLHDKTPVREFQSGDGHTVWADEAGRVHANNMDEVEDLRELARRHNTGSGTPVATGNKPKAESGLPPKAK